MQGNFLLMENDQHFNGSQPGVNPAKDFRAIVIFFLLLSDAHIS